MANIKKKIFAVAENAGYEGEATGGILGAIDALTDALVGEDVDTGTDIASAVGVLFSDIAGDGPAELDDLEGDPAPGGNGEK